MRQKDGHVTSCNIMQDPCFLHPLELASALMVLLNCGETVVMQPGATSKLISVSSEAVVFYVNCIGFRFLRCHLEVTKFDQRLGIRRF